MLISVYKQYGQSFLTSKFNGRKDLNSIMLSMWLTANNNSFYLCLTCLSLVLVHIETFIKIVKIGKIFIMKAFLSHYQLLDEKTTAEFQYK